MRCWLLFAVLAPTLACGARTGIGIPERADDGGAPPADAPPAPPCETDPPERFSPVEAAPLAADGARLWVDVVGPEMPVGVVDVATGELRVVEAGLFGVRSAVARDGQAWWTSTGRSDFAGALRWARSLERTRVLDEGLFQPGGVQHDGEWVYYAEWTNSGSLRDEGRGRILRIRPSGGGRRELASGLGLPTSTALAGRHVYFVDRRRHHVARVPRDGGTIEVAAEVEGIRGELAAGPAGVLFAAAGRSGDRLVRLGVPDHAQVELATVPGEVRGIAPAADGVLLYLWSAAGASIRSVWWLPDGAGEPVLLDPEGADPVVGRRWAYWSRGRASGRGDPGLVRVCLGYLSSL